MINQDNLLNIKSELGEAVKLIAVSKRQPDEKVASILELGHNILGENYVQALCDRYEKFKESPIEWHMIGHLQSNKVKYIAPFINLIHAVDSFSLLQTIHKEGLKNNRVINCLLQVHIAEEDSKFGFDESEIEELLGNPLIADFTHARIIGLMGMATFTPDENQVRDEFNYLKAVFEKLKAQFFTGQAEFKELSMGMSDDYKIAIEEGSTMVRIGTSIFGERISNSY